MNIGFIGFGKMAEALWQGMCQTEGVSLENTCFTDQSKEREQEIVKKFQLKPESLKELVKKSDWIFLCIKPQQLKSILIEFPSIVDSGKVLVSILAGTPVSVFQKNLGNNIAVIRVMPNTPATLSEGLSAIYCNNSVSIKHYKQCQELLKNVGQVIIMEDETHLDIATGISGSGPAFLYRIAKSMAEVGVERGLNSDSALTMAAQTLVGAGKMLLETGLSPDELIESVSSPNGTTVAGLEKFDDEKLDKGIKEVVKATIHRATELAKESS